jgi:hypothetical protein
MTSQPVVEEKKSEGRKKNNYSDLNGGDEIRGGRST